MDRVIVPKDCLVVTTTTGSRYAFARTTEEEWWVRPQARTAALGWPRTLADAWRPILPLAPWPPTLGRSIILRFADLHEVAIGGIPVAMDGEVRYTSTIVAVDRWTLEDDWPGPLPQKR